MAETTGLAEGLNLDLSNWPIVRYRMPDHVPDAEADRHVAAFDALLARKERFVLLFHGPTMPKNSPRFMKAYRAWFKANKDAQKRLCAGAVRIEPDPDRRGSFAAQAMTLMNKVFLPYPFRVVDGDAAALRLARAWLTA